MAKGLTAQLKEGKKRVNIVMSDKVHDRLKEFADGYGITLSSVVSLAVGSFLDSMDISKRMMDDPEFIGKVLDVKEKHLDQLKN